MSMKNCIDTVGNRTRDFPASSAVPQPTASVRALSPLSVILTFGSMTSHLVLASVSTPQIQINNEQVQIQDFYQHNDCKGVSSIMHNTYLPIAQISGFICNNLRNQNAFDQNLNWRGKLTNALNKVSLVLGNEAVEFSNTYDRHKSLRVLESNWTCEAKLSTWEYTTLLIESKKYSYLQEAKDQSHSGWPNP